MSGIRWPARAATLLNAGLIVVAIAAPATAAAPQTKPQTKPQTQPQDQAQTTAADDPFYVPPNPLPPGSRGDIIRFRSSTSPNGGATAWQILYRSTTVQGGATAVSGTVLVPTAPYPGTRPLVAYAPGTQGWGDQCAPSKSMANRLFDEQFAVDNLLARGFAVVVSDYPGLGTPGEETYNVGIPSAYAVLDGLRAATRLAPAGISPSAPMGIEGYSQGGGTAAWAAQLHATYAPELPLRGIAAGGTPANLQAVAANINGTLFFAFLAGTANGFNAAYPSLNLNGTLTPEGRTALARLAQLCQIEALVLYAGKRIENYTVGGVNPIDSPAWRAVLDANNAGRIRPGPPVLIYHGLLDEVIPWTVGRNLHRQWCGLGATTQLRSYIGEHVTTHLFAQGDVVSWLADRLAGQPARRVC